MAPDFGFWNDDGRLALVDWKTGGSTPDGAAFQLGCYALYAAEVARRAAGEGRPVSRRNLREPEVTQLTWSDERLQAIKEQLAPLGALDESVSGRSGRECRRDRRLREGRRLENLQMVQTSARCGRPELGS